MLFSCFSRLIGAQPGPEHLDSVIQHRLRAREVIVPPAPPCNLKSRDRIRVVVPICPEVESVAAHRAHCNPEKAASFFTTYS